MRWNGGVSWPVQSGHGCIGCSEEGFWDKGSFYDRVTDIKAFGVEANADTIGKTAAGTVGAAIAAHAAVTALARARQKAGETEEQKGDK
jgi:hydrogenase small subunit